MNLKEVLKKRELTAKELRMALEKFGWKIREPGRNQPHFYLEGVEEYIVVDERYGPLTIQKEKKWKKYIKRIMENQK